MYGLSDATPRREYYYGNNNHLGQPATEYAKKEYGYDYIVVVYEKITEKEMKEKGLHFLFWC